MVQPDLNMRNKSNSLHYCFSTSFQKPYVFLYIVPAKHPLPDYFGIFCYYHDYRYLYKKSWLCSCKWLEVHCELSVQVEAEKTELLQQLEFMGGEYPPSIKVVYIRHSKLLLSVISDTVCNYVVSKNKTTY